MQVWDLSTDKVDWVGAACRATMIGHQHTVRCLQVHVLLGAGVHKELLLEDNHIFTYFTHRLMIIR